MKFICVNFKPKNPQREICPLAAPDELSSGIASADTRLPFPRVLPSLLLTAAGQYHDRPRDLQASAGLRFTFPDCLFLITAAHERCH